MLNKLLCLAGHGLGMTHICFRAFDSSWFCSLLFLPNERQSGGTGVGLAISDRSLRMYGGCLRAFNAPGSDLIMEME